ncbi:MAG TPA: glycosyltransferase [Candidatus Limnocylindrales bacterium]|nr:glycosyltransferase [Candidatus Limnocylindrales bacterium]
MRVLFVQPSLNPPGGGNAVAAWMVQALAAEHDVTVLTHTPADLDAVNYHFGTSLQHDDARWICTPIRVPRMLVLAGLNGALLVNHRLSQHARAIRSGFDVAVTANNESDIGAPTLQYVHYPKLDPTRPGGNGPRPLLVAAYQRAVAALTGFSHARARGNRTLANSKWTAGRLHSLGMAATVLEPPVAMLAGTLPFDEREDRFVAIGRIAPEKRLETIIEIVERLRARGWRSGLCLAGARDDAAYADRIAALAAQRPWVEMRTDVSRPELTRILHHSRWSIHAMIDEHFGIAVAEMVRAGCMVFAHDSGGQVEIVGDARLRWRDADDAVAKIEAVAADGRLRARLARSLAARAAERDATVFAQKVQRLVREVASGRT